MNIRILHLKYNWKGAVVIINLKKIINLKIISMLKHCYLGIFETKQQDGRRTQHPISFIKF